MSGEISDLRASLARAQRELDAAHERLDALERTKSGTTKTALVPRVVDRQRKQLIVVGALSSAATAILLGLGALVFPSPAPAPAPTVIAMPPTGSIDVRPDIPPPPPLATVVVPLPEPAPVSTEPPRPPVRVARVPARDPLRDDAPKRARSDEAGEMGSMTVICLPVRCDSITDNGTPLGPGHIFSRPVAAGRHQLVLHSTNGVTKSLRVDVHADQLKEVRVMMSDASDIF